MKASSILSYIILIYILINKFGLSLSICYMQGSFFDSSCITNVLIIESPNANYRAGHFATNKEGDIIIEYSSEDPDNLRLYYGLRKNGSYYFLNEPHSKEKSVENINYNDEIQKGRYESKNIFVSLSEDINKNKEYLFSISSYKTLAEIFDLEKDQVYTKSAVELLDLPDGFYSYQFPNKLNIK